MKKWWPAMVLALSVLGCKGTASTGGGDEAAARPGAPPRGGEAKSPALPQPEKPVETISLTATVTFSKDAPAPFDVTLTRTATGRVRGQSTLQGIPLDFDGVVQDGQLRVWVSARGHDLDKVRRGYFIGELGDAAGSGTFAISGNGGDHNIRGVWKKH